MAEALARSPRLSKADLRRYFNQRSIPLNEISGQITVDKDVKALSGKQYTLRLYIPETFPNSSPMLAVVRPAQLHQFNGTPIPSDTPEYHTLGKHEGFQMISLPYSTTNLNTSVFIHQIFTKGIFWLDAYGEHLVTGTSVARYIREYSQVSNESRSAARIWSQAQVRRLIEESDMLDNFFGPNQVKWTEDRRAVDVTIKSLIGQKTYILRVHLHHDYPNSRPDLAIIYPEGLLQRNGQPLPPHSQEFHTLEKRDGPRGPLTICHFGPTEWMYNCNITSVVYMKGHVWVNAYELYLSERDQSFEDCLRKLKECSEIQ